VPQTIVITGASDGIGAAAARQLSALGERVAIVGRSETKTKAVADATGARSYIADFAELAQVRRLAEQLAADYPRIDVLANNAGGIMGPRALTRDGFERTFQVNHLAPFLLTNLLLPTLLASQAKVIQTASNLAEKWGNLRIDDLQHERAYSPNTAYGTAKLENILFTIELHRRFHDRGLSAAAFHPGIVRTNFASESSSPMRWAYHTPLRYLMTVSPEQGADGMVWLARGTPGQTWQSGRYYEKRRAATSHPQASDAGLARQLWDASAAMLSLAPATDSSASRPADSAPR
jgi:NAD(P)-dependent dehydrogenase (short-subunit alcohol dehydrogenase family)